MMTAGDDSVTLLGADGEPSSARAARRRYEAMKEALLKVVPADEKGIVVRELADRVALVLPPDFDAAVGWYTTAVRLDLEGRGLIERVPKTRPPRVRRVGK